MKKKFFFFLSSVAVAWPLTSVQALAATAAEQVLANTKSGAIKVKKLKMVESKTIPFRESSLSRAISEAVVLIIESDEVFGPLKQKLTIDPQRCFDEDLEPGGLSQALEMVVRVSNSEQRSEIILNEKTINENIIPFLRKVKNFSLCLKKEGIQFDRLPQDVLMQAIQMRAYLILAKAYPHVYNRVFVELLRTPKT